MRWFMRWFDGVVHEVVDGVVHEVLIGGLVD